MFKLGQLGWKDCQPKTQGLSLDSSLMQIIEGAQARMERDKLNEDHDCGTSQGDGCQGCFNPWANSQK